MTAVANAVPPPFGDAIAQMPRPGYKDGDPQAGLIGKAWAEWFRNLVNINEKSPARVSAVLLEDQNASIAATDMTNGGQFSAGRYRISWNIRCVTAGAVGDTAVVEIAWTDGGVARIYTATACKLEATTDQQVDKSILVRIDGLTPITYTVGYFTAANQPFYDLDIFIEEILA